MPPMIKTMTIDNYDVADVAVCLTAAAITVAAAVAPDNHRKEKHGQ
jgi:hypothetical protein